MDCGKPLNPSAARALVPSSRLSAPAAEPAADRRAVAPAAFTRTPAGGHPKPGAGRSSGAYPAPSTAQAPFAAPRPGQGPGGAPTADRRVSCPSCSRAVDGTLPFCGACGSRLGTADAAPGGNCGSCGAHHAPGDLFCARCGGRVGNRVSVERTSAVETIAFEARKLVQGPRLALLDDNGDVATVFTLERGEAVIGRGDADIRFSDDTYMSPLHARLEMREGVLWLRDLGSRNMSWVFLEEPARLADGDMLLIGSQIIRFRRIGFPGPYTPEVDATRRMGSLTPSADVATLEQLRGDGSTRDTMHLSPGRAVVIGRELGDWVFPYDQTMSGRHAEVRSEDSEFFVCDVGSRNGVAIAVRGQRALQPGQRLLLGDQLFRVEST